MPTTELIDENTLEVTVYDGEGNAVSHSFEKPFTATEEQHSEIISLVEGGMRADDATRLVLGI